MYFVLLAFCLVLGWVVYTRSHEDYIRWGRICYARCSKTTQSQFRILRSFSYQLQGLLYLAHGPEILDLEYHRADGSIFKVATPSNNHTLVTSETHVEELLHAPLHQLSLHAVAKEILQPKYTMHGFEWKDQRGQEGTGFVRALRSLLTSHLPQLMPQLRYNITRSFDSELRVNQTTEGSSSLQVFPTIKRVVTCANCVIFFGADLAQNTEFTAAALEFPQTVVLAAEILRITPRFLKTFVANLATSQHRAVRTLMSHLQPIVKQRMEVRDVIDLDQKPIDCMQWLIDTSPRKNPWTVERMIGEIMALWFGSVHQLAMTTTYCLQDLCHHPQWQSILREEISDTCKASELSDPDILKLLDCFARESMRTNPSDAISVRRKAIAPFEFSDGTKVNVGDWACLPLKAMLNDDSYYPDPTVFDPYRFMESHRETPFQTFESHPEYPASSRCTDVNRKWPVWGLGNAACPGRFYASTVMKLILIHVLTNYECSLSPKSSTLRAISWRSSILPRSDMLMTFSKRITKDREAKPLQNQYNLN